jgi:hypothetical protein
MKNTVEVRARAICELDLMEATELRQALAAAVDRYWHVIAAEIEAGLIDAAGVRVDYDHETGMKAYQAWCARHPVC